MTPSERRALIDRYQAEIPSGYLRLALPPWLITHTVNWTVERILELAPDAQAVAFRGLSGALIAPIVAYKLGLNPIGVRKKVDWSHGAKPVHTRTLERGKIDRYVIVDDFIDTGDTVREIVKDYWTTGMNLLGVFCYGWGMSNERPVALVPPDINVMAFGVVPDDIYPLFS